MRADEDSVAPARSEGRTDFVETCLVCFLVSAATCSGLMLLFGGMS